MGQNAGFFRACLLTQVANKTGLRWQQESYYVGAER